MKKVLFITVALVLVLSIALVGCTGGGPVAPTSVKVGVARDLDGPLAPFECGYGGAVYRWFANKVNAAGGIALSDYSATVPLELIVRDFDVITWDIGAVTEGLLDTDKVDFVWGGPGTDCIFTQAPICNAAAKVLITLEGGASSMIWDGNIDTWPYVWVTLSFANWNQIPVLHDMLEAQPEISGRNATAYITGIGELGATHGIEYTKETKDVFGEANVIDAGLHPYSLTAEQAATIILDAEATYNATPYDIFCAYTYPWNVATLTVAIMASNFNPPAILFGPGGNANTYPFYFGPNAQGVMSFIVADNHTSTAISELYGELAAQVELDWGNSTLKCAKGDFTSGWQSLDYWGMPCYAAGLQLWEDAVVQAGNINSPEVRDVLASLNTTTVLGNKTWFDVFGGGLGGGILSFNCHPAEIGQWQSGDYRSVGGIAPTASVIYPMTDSWFWLD